MTFVSTHFGSIAVDESSTIEFPEGLPGFEERRRFLPLQNGVPGSLIFLQSLERADLCFLAVPVQVTRPGYQLCMAPEDLELLELSTERQPSIGREVAALAIISLVEGQDPTVNLRSRSSFTWRRGGPYKLYGRTSFINAGSRWFRSRSRPHARNPETLGRIDPDW